MPDNNRVGAHRVQRHRGINQRFAFFYARLRRVHIDDVRAEPLSGNLERQQGARRVLKKGVDNRQTAQPVVMLCRARAIERHPMLRLLQNIENFPGLKPGDTKQVLVRKGGRSSWEAVGGSLRCRCH